MIPRSIEAECEQEGSLFPFLFSFPLQSSISNSFPSFAPNSQIDNMKNVAAVSALAIASLASYVTAAPLQARDGPSGTGKSCRERRIPRSADFDCGDGHCSHLVVRSSWHTAITVVAPTGGTVVRNDQRFQNSTLGIEYDCISRIKPDTATTLGIKVSLQQGDNTYVVSSRERSRSRILKRCCFLAPD